MTTLFSTIPQSRQSLQFIPYNGPPNPKPTYRRTSSKQVSPNDDEYPNIDESLGIDWGNREELARTEHGVEVVDLSFIGNEANCEIAGESGDVSNNPTNEQEDVSMPTFQEVIADKASRQPAPSKGSSQGNAVVINESDLEADTGDEECPYLHVRDRLESSRASTPEYRDGEVRTSAIDAINLEMFDGAETQASELMHRRVPSTPPTSLSIMNIEQSAQKALRRTHPKATTHQQRRSTVVKLPYLEITSSGSSSAGSDTDDDGHSHTHIPPRTCKRKRPAPANGASRKRQSRGLLKPSTTSVVPSAKRQKPTLSQKKAASGGGLSDATLASAAQSSVCDSGMSSGEDSSAESGYRGRNFQKERKPMKTNRRSVWSLRSNAEDASSNPAPPHATRETRLFAPIQWHLSDVTFYSLSTEVSFLTAIFRARSGPGILATSHAVNILKSVVGDPTKVEDITIKPLTSDTWLLTSFVYLLTGAVGCGIGQLLPAPSSSPPSRTDNASLRDCGNHDDDETSYKDYDQNFDNDIEYLSDVVNKPSRSRTRTRWSEEDDNRLRDFKKKNKPWSWIYKEFPGRSHGAVQVRWHTKLRGKA